MIRPAHSTARGGRRGPPAWLYGKRRQETPTTCGFPRCAAKLPMDDPTNFMCDVHLPLVPKRELDAYRMACTSLDLFIETGSRVREPERYDSLRGRAARCWRMAVQAAIETPAKGRQEELIW